MSLVLALLLALGAFSGTALGTEAEQASECTAQYTLDGNEALLVSGGATAEGNVSVDRDGTVLPEDELTVYFTTSDATIATVNAATGDVAAVGEGIATITAYVLLDGEVLSDHCFVTVTDDTDLASMKLSVPVGYVGVGNEMQLSLSGKKASGINADMSKVAVAYSVDETACAKVSDSGRLTGLQEGTVTVTAQVSQY